MENTIKEIVESLKDYADDIKAQGKIDLFDEGQILGCVEALTIIRGVCGDMDLNKIGLDFDPEARYL